MKTVDEVFELIKIREDAGDALLSAQGPGLKLAEADKVYVETTRDLRTAIEELHRDALRYQWLMSNAYVGIAPYPKPHEVWCLRLPNPNNCANLDAAIDAAMKEST